MPTPPAATGPEQHVGGPGGREHWRYRDYRPQARSWSDGIPGPSKAPLTPYG